MEDLSKISKKIEDITNHKDWKKLSGHDGKDLFLPEIDLEVYQYKNLDEIFANLKEIITESPLKIDQLDNKIEYIKNSFESVDSRLREIKKIGYIRRGLNNLLKTFINNSCLETEKDSAKNSIKKIDSFVIDLLKNRYLTVDIEELE